jgi:hypothetical protein
MLQGLESAAGRRPRWKGYQRQAKHGLFKKTC